MRGRHGQTHGAGIYQRAAKMIGHVAGAAKETFHAVQIAQHEPARDFDARREHLRHPHQRVDRRGHRVERGKHASAPPRDGRRAARR